MITPGEWKVTCERNREGAYNNVDAVQQEWPRQTIALLPCSNPDTPDNQHLIATAPALLLACEALVPWAEGPSSHPRTCDCDRCLVIHDAHVALAKARGEP